MKKIILFSIILISIIKSGYTQEKFTSNEGRFTLKLPKGWRYEKNQHEDLGYGKFYTLRYYRDDLPTVSLAWISILIRPNISDNLGTSLKECEYSDSEQKEMATDGVGKPLKIISSGALIVDNTFACYVEYQNEQGVNAKYILHRPDMPSWECQIQTHFYGKKGEEYEAIEEMLRKTFKYL